MVDNQTVKKIKKTPLTTGAKVGIGIAGIAASLFVAATIFLAVWFTIGPVRNRGGRLRVGYAPIYGMFRQGRGWFAPYKINPQLYSHVVMAFLATSEKSGWHLYMPDLGDWDIKTGRTAQAAETAMIAQYKALRDGCGSINSCTDVYKNFGGLQKPFNKDLKLLVSVGGWNASAPTTHGTFIHSDLSAIMTNPEARASFVSNTVKYVVDNELDGVDMDIEYPGKPQGGGGGDPAEVPGYTMLMQALGQALHANGKLLTCAVGLGMPIVTYSYEWGKLSGAVDYINLMAYDMYGAFSEATGPNTPLNSAGTGRGTAGDSAYIDRAVEYIIRAGADPKKLVLGLAAYGRTMPLCPGSKPTPLEPYGKPFFKTCTGKCSDQGACPDPDTTPPVTQCVDATTQGCFPSGIIQTKEWDVPSYVQFQKITNLSADLPPMPQCACGMFTAAQGSLSFYEILDLIQCLASSKDGCLQPDEAMLRAAIAIDTVTSTASAYFKSGGIRWDSTTPKTDEYDVLVSFDSLETIGIKCQYALDKDFAGVMLWTIADDDMATDFPISSLMDQYMKKGSKGKSAPHGLPTTVELQLKRAMTPTGCEFPSRSDPVVMGGGWNILGTLASFEAMGKHNLGCMWDWPKVVMASNATVTRTCAPTGGTIKPIDGCNSVKFNNGCWLDPGATFDLSKFTLDGTPSNPCGGNNDEKRNYYPSTYQPYYCQSGAKLCGLCTSDSDCAGSSCDKKMPDECKLRGYCPPNAINGMACQQCNPADPESCPMYHTGKVCTVASGYGCAACDDDSQCGNGKCVPEGSMDPPCEKLQNCGPISVTCQDQPTPNCCPPLGAYGVTWGSNEFKWTGADRACTNQPDIAGYCGWKGNPHVDGQAPVPTYLPKDVIGQICPPGNVCSP